VWVRLQPQWAEVYARALLMPPEMFRLVEVSADRELAELFAFRSSRSPSAAPSSRVGGLREAGAAETDVGLPPDWPASPSHAAEARRGQPASEAQRAKVAGRACPVCRRRPVDPAHLVPRSLGGCDDAACFVPLCRRCHHAYDRGELDLLRYLERRCGAELAHGVTHLPLLALLRRVTGKRWAPR
jgi:hypothetical protein